MSVLDFIARFSQHIPDAGFQMVRYYGQYSNRMRGDRKTEAVPEFMLVKGEESSYGKTWRQLIWKIYEVDPLRCSECGEQLELINIVTDKKQISLILSRLESQKAESEPHAPP